MTGQQQVAGRWTSDIVNCVARDPFSSSMRELCWEVKERGHMYVGVNPLTITRSTLGQPLLSTDSGPRNTNGIYKSANKATKSYLRLLLTLSARVVATAATTSSSILILFALLFFSSTTTSSSSLRTLFFDDTVDVSVFSTLVAATRSEKARRSAVKRTCETHPSCQPTKFSA
jgi:hypothetical protein